MKWNFTEMNQHLKEVLMLASIHQIAARLLQSHDPKRAVLLDQSIREMMAQLPECQEAAAAAQRPGVRVIRVLPRGPEVSDAAAGPTLRIIHIRHPARRRGKDKVEQNRTPSWPGLSRPSTSWLMHERLGMRGTSPRMTVIQTSAITSDAAVCTQDSGLAGGGRASERRRVRKKKSVGLLPIKCE
jgi:hypothetical protein